MSYLYSQSAAAGTVPGASGAYTRSPYAAAQQVPAAAPHSPYAHPGQPQAAGPYPGATQSSFAAGGATLSTYPGQPPQRSPMPGQTYLPSSGQLTATSAPMTPSQPSQPFQGNVSPGAVTYTTTTDPLGRVTYHHFRAEPATYHSPQGVTYTGIQWVPTETSSVPPVGIPLAGPDVIASFRGQIPTAPSTGQTPNPGLGLDYRDETRDWEKDERRRRKEEKRRNTAWEEERLARERAEDREIRKARERDAEHDRAARLHRRSYGAGLGADRELERRMGELDVSGRDAYHGDYTAPAPGTRSRRQSIAARASGGIYEDPAYERDSDEYGGAYRRRDQSRRRSGIYAAPEQPLDPYGASERSRPASIYGASARDRSRPPSMYGPDRSPYRRDTATLQPAIGPDGVEVYPAGHILAGQPVSGSGFVSSRNPSPNLRPAAYGGGLPVTSPRVGVMGSAISPRIGASTPLVGGYGGQAELLPAPESFNRPINHSQTFTPFKDVRVQDLDELLDDVFHPMPAVLSTHDMLPEDWGRLMHDLTLAWKGRLPLPLDKPTKKSDLVIDLLDLWNSMFLVRRLAELVLYKGRNCRSGPGAGLPETRLLPEQLYDPDEPHDSDDESDEESEGEYSGERYDHRYGSHGRRGHGRSQSQRREIARATRKKQRIEEKVQREMEVNKKYTLWLKYVDPREREY